MDLGPAASLDCGLPGLFVEPAMLDVGEYDFMPYCSPALGDQTGRAVLGGAAAGLADALTLSPTSLMAKDDAGFGAAYSGVVDPTAIFEPPNAAAANARSSAEPTVFGELGVLAPDDESGMSSPFSVAAALSDRSGPFGGREVHRSPHASEQRRRALMNRCYRRLRDMLLVASGRRRSKADLLDDAVNELERLRNAEATYRANIQLLTAHVARAHQQLLAAGLAPAAVGAEHLAVAADLPRNARTGATMRPLAPAPHQMRR